jgi:hypothetical protein
MGLNDDEIFSTQGVATVLMIPEFGIRIAR